MTRISAETIDGVIGARLSEWLEKRGLDSDVAFRLGWISVRVVRGRNQKGPPRVVPDEGGDWVAMPAIVEGYVVGWKYRQIGTKRFFIEGRYTDHVVNEDALRGVWRDGEGVLVTEGETDLATGLTVMGVQARIVSVPNGAPKRADGAIKWLERLIDLVPAGAPITIASDDDEDGAGMLRVLSARTGAARCRQVRYPHECNDLNETLTEGGEDAVLAVLTGAKPVPVSGLYKSSEIVRAPERVVWRPQIAPELDAMAAICPQHFSVWTGVPNEGKSTITEAIFWDILDRYDLMAAWYSGEKDASDVLDDVCCWRAGVPTPNLLSDAQRAQGLEWAERHLMHIIDDDNDAETGEPHTLDWLLERAETAIVRHGARIVHIDPWNDLEHEYDFRAMTETQYIGQAHKAIKRFARRYDVHVSIVAHPTKPERGKKMNGYAISGSAHWFNKPFLGATVSRHDPDDPSIKRRNWPTKVWFWKIKYHEWMGYPGETLIQRGADRRFKAYMTDEDYTNKGRSTPA